MSLSLYWPTAVSYISTFEKELVNIARIKKCDGVICGHIHTPAICKYDSIKYMNSGDWVESLSALVEDYFGNWKIVYYSELTEENNNQKHLEEVNMPGNSSIPVPANI